MKNKSKYRKNTISDTLKAFGISVEEKSEKQEKCFISLKPLTRGRPIDPDWDIHTVTLVREAEIAEAKARAKAREYRKKYQEKKRNALNNNL